MSRERVNYYLKQLVKNGFIIRVKQNGKMSYYTAQRESEMFRLEKRFYGLNTLQKSGLFEHLNSLKNIKSIMLFGSFVRGDWDKSSDIDLFIFGDARDFDKEKFEIKLGREIQLFSYKDKKLIKKELDPKLMPNIYNGFNIKGSIEPFEVKING